MTHLTGKESDGTNSVATIIDDASVKRVAVQLNETNLLAFKTENDANLNAIEADIESTNTKLDAANASLDAIESDVDVIRQQQVDGTQRVKIDSWIGSTAPTVGQKTMANSVPVVLASDQTNLNTSVISQAVSVTNVATKLPTSNLANRKILVLYNNSGKIVEIGGASVTYGNGLPIDSKQTLVLEVSALVDVYGIVNSGSADMRILEGY